MRLKTGGEALEYWSDGVLESWGKESGREETAITHPCPRLRRVNLRGGERRSGAGGRLVDSGRPAQLAIFSALHGIDRGCDFEFVLVNLGPLGCGQRENCQTVTGEILLIAQVLIGSDEHVELVFGGS